ncbi:enoyl-CoA hydratase/isomerase family protein [Pseudochelatococcus sp. B33]
MTYETIILEHHAAEKVTAITLNRPEKLNSINGKMVEELGRAIDEIVAAKDANAIVLRGAGSAFTAGYDLKADDFDRDIETWRDDLDSVSALFKKVYSVPLPIVAAVQGYAIGGGLELMMCCDFAIAAKNAKFGESEVRHASGAPSVLLPWHVPMRHARYLLYTGDLINGDEAQNIHLVNRAVPAEEVDTEAFALARKLASVPLPAIKFIKQSLNHVQAAAGFFESWAHNQELICALHTTNEGRRWLRMLNEMPLKEFLEIRNRPFK